MHWPWNEYGIYLAFLLPTRSSSLKLILAKLYTLHSLAFSYNLPKQLELLT